MVTNLNNSIAVSGGKCWHTDTKQDLAVLVDFDWLAKLVVAWLEHNIVNLLELVVDGSSAIMLISNIDLVKRDLSLILTVPAVALLVRLVLRHNKSVLIVRFNDVGLLGNDGRFIDVAVGSSVATVA